MTEHKDWAMSGADAWLSRKAQLSEREALADNFRTALRTVVPEDVEMKANWLDGFSKSLLSRGYKADSEGLAEVSTLLRAQAVEIQRLNNLIADHAEDGQLPEHQT